MSFGRPRGEHLIDYGIYMVRTNSIINLLLVTFAPANKLLHLASLTCPSSGTPSHVCSHHQTPDFQVLALILLDRHAAGQHADHFVMWIIMNSEPGCSYHILAHVKGPAHPVERRLPQTDCWGALQHLQWNLMQSTSPPTARCPNGTLLARPIRSYNYVHCFILHLTWGQTKRDTNTANEELMTQFHFQLQVRTQVLMAGSLQLSNGELWQSHASLPRMRKWYGNGWKRGCWCGRNCRRAAPPGPQHRQQHPDTAPPGTHASESPTVAHNSTTATPGPPRTGSMASLVQGCHCLAPGNVNMNHKARTVLENYSSICCKTGDKAGCLSVQSFLCLKESQIQTRVFSRF